MEILRLSEIDIKDAAKRAAQILKKGGIVAFPTDTLYGLAVDAGNEDALERLRLLKGRERKRPISLIVPDVGSIKKVGTLTESARALAEKFLPGALTLVVPAAASVSESLTLNGAVGIRIPDEEFCIALAKAFGRPFTATSANLTGLTTATTIEDLIWHFGPKVAAIDLMIDGGPRSGAASTVVSCVTEPVSVLRDGALSRAELGL